MNLYKILEIPDNSTDDDIKKAYHKLAKKYHPDKNNNSDESKTKFQQINYAYQILINSESRCKYLNLNNNEKEGFMSFLIKLINNNLSNSDFVYPEINKLNKINFKNFLNNLNLTDFIKIFKKEKININTTEPLNCSDTENESFINEALYFNELPIKYLNYNINNIHIDLSINLSSILSGEKKKIKILRNNYKKQVKSDFVFETKTPFVVFDLGGDIDENNEGHLIIKLTLNDMLWENNKLLYLHKISLYQFIYGLDFEIIINNKNYSYNNWIPSRDGMIIILNNNINKLDIGIKFIINYNHSDEKLELLKNNFS
jgi:DnaJ-class molecular chaperone